MCLKALLQATKLEVEAPVTSNDRKRALRLLQKYFQYGQLLPLYPSTSSSAGRDFPGSADAALAFVLVNLRARESRFDRRCASFAAIGADIPWTSLLVSADHGRTYVAALCIVGGK